jgi:hypothetical protein
LPYAEGVNATKKAQSPPRTVITAAQRLLVLAAEEIGEALQDSLRISPERVEQWKSGAVRMSLSEQAALALAVLSIAPSGSRLFRQAAALRGQVRAAAEYESGTTVRHLSGPVMFR